MLYSVEPKLSIAYSFVEILSRLAASRSVEGLDIQQAIDNIRDQLEQDEAASPAMRASIEMLILVVSLLLNRSNLNSRNSSKPPATDPNRMKPSRKKSDKLNIARRY